MSHIVKFVCKIRSTEGETDGVLCIEDTNILFTPKGSSNGPSLIIALDDLDRISRECPPAGRGVQTIHKGVTTSFSGTVFPDHAVRDLKRQWNRHIARKMAKHE
eukprot:gnl/Dysnectes_brevis/5380_a7714_553.p1 GENE.gnl/Dysnectes_brevis/5380_a7714_553~~gnl/Dysnectes_brevis/5380_a7714_553.p1  ORF type:complete len:104 (+),score=12.29 gnl/Dysnectes_brevis/5380_a7714_553:88-399(+)